MRTLPILVALALAQAPQGGPYARHFTDDTMRVDIFHTGGPRSGETIALDRVVNDGPWAGSRTMLLDDMDLGPYLFEVRDEKSRALLYSRGFASIYGEWATTAEAKTAHRTYHESLRFPWPRQPVEVAIRKRQPDNTFGPAVWTTTVDPGSRFVNRAALRHPEGLVRPLFESGPPSTKVDLLLIAEGARGLYRPEADCIMFTRNPVGFCAVCRRALERIIDAYAQ